MVASGKTHTLALRADGTVWAWGSNTYGQLGIADSYYAEAEAAIRNQVRAYHWATRALDVEGYSVLHSFTAPQQVVGGVQAGAVDPIVENIENGRGSNGAAAFLQNIVAIAAGDYTSYALDSSGQVYAWGYNEHGELGNGTFNDWRVCHWGTHGVNWNGWRSDWTDYFAVRDTGAYYPVKVSNLTDAISITAGRDYAAAVCEDGTVSYWGNNGRYFDTFTGLALQRASHSLCRYPLHGPGQLYRLRCGYHCLLGSY
jgi:alpha-tubulin suppressor-like RCC1 family protein